MTKAESQAAALAYANHVNIALQHEKGQAYRFAISSAIDAWRFVPGMMLHAAKYEDHTVTSIVAFDIALRLCPVTLDLPTLVTLEGLLDSERRRLKPTPYVAQNLLGQAKSLLWDLHRLFSALSDNENIAVVRLSDLLGGEQSEWISRVKTLSKMGLVVCNSKANDATIRLASRLDSEAIAICPNCGVIDHDIKRNFLDPRICKSCGNSGSFVLADLGLHSSI